MKPLGKALYEFNVRQRGLRTPLTWESLPRTTKDIWIKEERRIAETCLLLAKSHVQGAD